MSTRVSWDRHFRYADIAGNKCCYDLKTNKRLTRTVLYYM